MLAEVTVELEVGVLIYPDLLMCPHPAPLPQLVTETDDLFIIRKYIHALLPGDQAEEAAATGCPRLALPPATGSADEEEVVPVSLMDSMDMSEREFALDIRNQLGRRKRGTRESQ